MRVENSVVPLWYRQQNFSEFVKAYKAHRARPLFFVGSGLSIGAGLPTWKDLLLALATATKNQRLIDEVAILLSSSDYKRFQRAGTILSKEYFVLGEGSWRLWRRTLEDILQPNKAIDPSRAHNLLVSLDWHRIITTNYDCLLEKAIENIKKEDVLISNPWSPSRQQLEPHRGPCVYKIHGDIADQDSKIILTAEDYEEHYQQGSGNIFERTLGSLLRSASVILFLGYGHNDPYVQEIIRRSMTWVNTRNVFALLPTPEDGMSADEFRNHLGNLSQELGIKFITYSSANNHAELLELLDFLREPSRLYALYESGKHVKRPTVVMLYCGGTIGSELNSPDTGDAGTLGVTVRTSRFDPELARFSKRLQDWHGEIYNTSEEMEIDIQWELLPPESQILSENATSETWNSIVTKLDDIIYKYFYGPNLLANEAQIADNRLRQIYEEERAQYRAASGGEDLNEKSFILDIEGRYVLGIILLHGTDTLAYTASALALSLHNLPCSVVITGANHPPIDKSWGDLSIHYNSSDAWRNLMSSIYFLVSFGHRLTETFVCFGDTVHNGVNLRKVAIDLTPFSKDPGMRQQEEPFIFRNQLSARQYMFKLVDGLFCNNYYSSALFSYWMLVKDDVGEFRDLRHIRWDALDSEPSRAPAFNYFSPSVGYLKLSPLLPMPNAFRDAPDEGLEDELRVILVEGYESGTYPSHSGHRFYELLQALDNSKIPIVLVSSSGIRATQRSYVTLPVNGRRVPVLRLYGIIVETALPLLSLVIRTIPAADRWRESSTQEKLAIIQSGIAQVFRRKNIISEELADICNSEEMNTRIVKAASLAREAESDRRRDFRKRGGFLAPIFPSGEGDASDAVEFGEGSFVSLSRWDFILILEEIVRPFDRIGAGPDGFAVVSDMGFEFGFSLTSSFSRRRFSNLRGGEYLFQCSEERQGKLFDAGNYLLTDMKNLLQRTRIGDMRVTQPLIVSLDTSQKRRFFSFVLTFSEPFGREARDEKYAAESYSEGEDEFFSRLRHPTTEDKDIEKRYDDLRRIYRRQMKETWTKATRTLDWFLIGIFKGVACQLASLMRFDPKAVAWRLYPKNSDHERVLRQAVRCRILESDRDYITLRFEYYEAGAESD